MRFIHAMLEILALFNCTKSDARKPNITIGNVAKINKSANLRSSFKRELLVKKDFVILTSSNLKK